MKKKKDHQLGNILWLIFGGFIFGVISYVVGALYCLTIILIPFAFRYFKLGKFFLSPMGKKVVYVRPSGFKTFLNIAYAIFSGWEPFLTYFGIGALFCMTIVGIPFGKQYFKLAHYVLTPLSHDFREEETNSVKR